MCFKISNLNTSKIRYKNKYYNTYYTSYQNFLAYIFSLISVVIDELLTSSLILTKPQSFLPFNPKQLIFKTLQIKNVFFSYCRFVSLLFRDF